MAVEQRAFRVSSALAGCLAAVGIGACTPEIGSEIGTAVGSLGGSYITRADPTAGAALSDVTTTLGSLIGSEIARYLDAQERVQAESAARDSLNSEAIGPSSTRTWTSQTNPDVSGGSTIVAQRTGADGRQCRTQRNFVNVKGQDVEQRETLCRDPGTGSWVAAA